MVQNAQLMWIGLSFEWKKKPPEDSNCPLELTWYSSYPLENNNSNNNVLKYVWYQCQLISMSDFCAENRNDGECAETMTYSCSWQYTGKRKRKNKTIWFCDVIHARIHENWPQFQIPMGPRISSFYENVVSDTGKGYSKHIFQDTEVHFPWFFHYWKIVLQNSKFSRFSRMRGNPVKLQKKRRNGKKQRTRERINKCLLPLHKNHANNTQKPLMWEWRLHSITRCF